MQTHTKKCCNPKQILTNIHRLCNRLMADLFHKASLFWKMEVTFVATVLAGNTQNDSEETISSPSCRPLLDCSFKDLNELFQSVEEIIQCFHNPAYTGLHWPLSHTCIFKSVHKRTHTHLLQVFTVLLMTCRKGLRVCDSHLLWSSWLCTEQDLSRVNLIFDGLHAFEILWDLLAFSSPAFFSPEKKMNGLVNQP